MTGPIIPFDRYPNLPPLFRAFLAGTPALFPDRPDIPAAAARARQILGRKARIPASAFRCRGPEGRERAEALASGRAVAVVAGHQVGLFTGPLFALLKAFDAIRVAREISAAGVPAVAVFYALTDDHDLEEIARTARPGADGPEILIVEGADRANRRPVGQLPVPAKVTEVIEAFRADIKAPGAAEILEAFARRCAPGVSYADAFSETLLDLVDPDALLVLDPLASGAAAPAAEVFLTAVRRQSDLREAWRSSCQRIAAAGHEPTVPFREDVFPFFTIENGERRRVGSPEEAARLVSAGSALPSADVLTRPAFKAFLVPVAASILGPAEIAYHAESLAFFPLFDLPAPVLLPRTHAVPTGPAERRAMKALGLSPADVLAGPAPASAAVPPEAGSLSAIARDIESRLADLDQGLTGLDPTLKGALETTRRKVAYQIEQLMERTRKAAERRDDVDATRRKRLETMLRPAGAGPDRLYPPLVWLLAHGRAALPAIRAAAQGSLEGAVVIDLSAETESRPEPGGRHRMPVDILAVGAHPDDIELTCGGTLVMLGRRGRRFGILDLTSGEMGTRGSVKTREAEAQAAAKILGAAFRETLDLTDGGLQTGRAAELAVIEVIRREKPRLVLTSYPADRHPDHARAGRLVADAAFYAGLRKLETAHPAHRPQHVLHYSTFLTQEPSLLVDVTPAIEVRRNAIRAFSSQFHDPDSKEPATMLSQQSFLDQVEARLRHFGLQAGVEFAEGFVSTRPPRIDDLVQVFEGFEAGF